MLLLADIDDIQSAVCILIVLGDRRKDIPLDELVHVSVFQLLINEPARFNKFNCIIHFIVGILAFILYRFTATPSILDGGNGNCEIILATISVPSESTINIGPRELR